MTSTRPSSATKSFGFLVYSGSSTEHATAAIIRSTARAPRLSADGRRSCIDSPVCPRCIGVERQRSNCCLGALQAVLTTRTLCWVFRGMGSSGEFGHGERGDSNLDRKDTDVEVVEIDHH